MSRKCCALLLFVAVLTDAAPPARAFRGGRKASEVGASKQRRRKHESHHTCRTGTPQPERTCCVVRLGIRPGVQYALRVAGVAERDDHARKHPPRTGGE